MAGIVGSHHFGELNFKAISKLAPHRFHKGFWLGRPSVLKFVHFKGVLANNADDSLIDLRGVGLDL